MRLLILLSLLAMVALVLAQPGPAGPKGQKGQAGEVGSPGVCSGTCTGGGGVSEVTCIAIITLDCNWQSCWGMVFPEIKIFIAVLIVLLFL